MTNPYLILFSDTFYLHTGEKNRENGEENIDNSFFKIPSINRAHVFDSTFHVHDV
jgi:hypothetical protein